MPLNPGSETIASISPDFGSITTAAPPDAPVVAPEMRRLVARDGLWMTALASTSLLLAGPPASFSALVGAQLGYALACRAPGSAPDEQFLKMLGGTAALHLGAITLSPTRRLLRLPPVLAPGELLAFGTGFALPWFTARSARDPVVIRHGRPSEETT